MLLHLVIYLTVEESVCCYILTCKSDQAWGGHILLFFLLCLLSFFISAQIPWISWYLTGRLIRFKTSFYPGGHRRALPWSFYLRSIISVKSCPGRISDTTWPVFTIQKIYEKSYSHRCALIRSLYTWNTTSGSRGPKRHEKSLCSGCISEIARPVFMIQKPFSHIYALVRSFSPNGLTTRGPKTPNTIGRFKFIWNYKTWLCTGLASGAGILIAMTTVYAVKLSYMNVKSSKANQMVL